jgi:TonB family protein
MFEDRSVLRTNLSLVMAIVLHIGGILLMSRTVAHGESAADLQEVSFMDVTYRPEVVRVLSKEQMSGGGGSGTGPADFGNGAPTYGSGVAADETGTIDMSAALARDNSQAQIDMDRYELDRGGEGMGVIRLGGGSAAKSTEEILAQPKVQLARGLARGGTGSGGFGLRGVPGVAQPQAQLTIEHRQLATPTARQLPTMTPSELPKVEGPVSRGTNFMVAGPISQREITKRIVPRYPKWALERRISGTVVVRIWVQPNGQVKGAPTVESSSGYPDLDQVVVDALRGWEFVPLGSGVKTEDQWGVITFKFMLS